MRRTLIPLLFGITLLIALLIMPSIAAAGSDELRARADLVRVASSPDPDAKGHVEIRSRTDRSDERFQVETEHLAPGDEVTVLVGDGAGGLVEAGRATAGSDGEAQLELDTGDGASLPAGAASAAALSGRSVEVRDATGATLLVGTVPSFSSPSGSSGGDDDDGDDSSSSSSREKRRARSFLVRAEGASDGDAKGHVEIRSEPERGRERFKVEAEHLTPGAMVSIEIGDGAGGTIDLGTFVADGEGEAELQRNTGDGDPLPGGAATAEDLSGRAVTVRDADGRELLTGTVPSFDGAATGAGRARAEVSAGDGSDARVVIKLRARDEGGKLRLALRGLPADADVELWVEDPAGGAFEMAMELETSSKGRVKVKLDTRKGDPLPLGLIDAADLAGLGFEIRSTAGDVLLSGTFPGF